MGVINFADLITETDVARPPGRPGGAPRPPAGPRARTYSSGPG